MATSEDGPKPSRLSVIYDVAFEYAEAVFRHGWTLGAGVLSTVLGVVGYFTSLGFPSWIWVALAAGCLVIVQFRAFLDVRNERDELSAELDRLKQKPVVQLRLNTEEEPGVIRIRIVNEGPGPLPEGTVINLLVPRSWNLVALNGEGHRLQDQWDRITKADEPILLKSGEEVPGSSWHKQMWELQEGVTGIFWFLVENYTEQARVAAIVVGHRRENWWLWLAAPEPPQIF